VYNHGGGEDLTRGCRGVFDGGGWEEGGGGKEGGGKGGGGKEGGRKGGGKEGMTRHVWGNSVTGCVHSAGLRKCASTLSPPCSLSSVLGGPKYRLHMSERLEKESCRIDYKCLNTFL
jgi:hypothetical protein